MKKLTLLTLPLAALALAACGQKTTTPPGGQNPPASQTYTKVGVVVYGDEFKSTALVAKFITAASPVNLADLKGSSTPDTCQLGIPPTNIGFSALSQVTFSTDKGLDAGDALIFKKSGVTFVNVTRAEVQVQAVGPSYNYTTKSIVLSGLSNLTVSVPGAAGGFPAFTDVPFPVPNQTFDLKTPADLKSVTATTAFTWTGASNDPEAMVLLFVVTDGFSFFCTAQDDGSFSIPSDFRDVLKAQNFTKGRALIVQYLTQFKTSGDALLALQSVSIRGSH